MSMESQTNVRAGFWLSDSQIEKVFGGKDLEEAQEALYESTLLTAVQFGNAWSGNQYHFYALDLSKNIKTEHYGHSQSIPLEYCSCVHEQLKVIKDKLIAKGIDVKEPVITSLLSIY